jgi:hypothetical protein
LRFFAHEKDLGQSARIFTICFLIVSINIILAFIHICFF